MCSLERELKREGEIKRWQSGWLNDVMNKEINKHYLNVSVIFFINWQTRVSEGGQWEATE